MRDCGAISKWRGAIIGRKEKQQGLGEKVTHLVEGRKWLFWKPYPHVHSKFEFKVASTSLNEAAHVKDFKNF